MGLIILLPLLPADFVIEPVGQFIFGVQIHFSDWAITACLIWQTSFAKYVSVGGKVAKLSPKSLANGVFAPNSVAVNSRTGRAKHLNSE